MKKAGLISIAAAAALATSAYAAEFNLSADAEVTGKSLRAPGSSEETEWYGMEVNLGVEAKNEDGIALKASWVIYDNSMASSSLTVDSIQPTLDYGYIVAPLMEGLTLKSGYVEAGPFGTNLTNSGDSTFKPFALTYKFSDAVSISFEEHMKTESDSNNTDGGMIFGAGFGDKSANRIAVGGKIGDLKYGARVTMTYTGDTNPSITVNNEKTDMQTEAYVTGKASIVNYAAHLVMKDGDSFDDATPFDGINDTKDSQMGLYAHVLVSPIENLTTGAAFVMLDGFETGAEFDPTYLTDEALNTLNVDPTTGKTYYRDPVSNNYENYTTTLLVVPVIWGINDMFTLEANLAFGELLDASFNEIDLGLNIALGKATNVKLMYATASGDALDGKGSPTLAPGTLDVGIPDGGADFMGWSVSTTF